MPKHIILKNIPKDKLLNMIPPVFRMLVDLNSIQPERINLVLFSPDNKYVTTSSEVKKVLDEKNTLQPLVALGWSFTMEAADLLKKSADYFVYKEDSFWTDESYHNARQRRNG